MNLAWNPNPETNITGYQLSYGTSPGVRSTVIEVGAKTTAAVTGLKQGSTYYFAVTATNSAGLQGAPSAEISYQVPANQIPVAAAKSVSTPEDSSVSVILSAADADGTALTYSVVAGPSKGKLSGSAPNLMYAPNADFSGADSFTFKANDGSADSNIATISITVSPVNDAPVAAAKSVSTAQGVPVSIILSATDKDGNALSYFTVSGPSKGVLSGNPPNLTYTPNAGTSGPDSFTYLASDGTADSDPATVSINVTAPANRAPVAAANSITTPEDLSVSVILSATDADGTALTYSVVAGPTKGKLSGSVPNLIYAPNADYNGADSFTFKANDGSADSNIATISITVSPVNDAPVAAAKSVSTAQGVPVSIILSATDKDGNALSYFTVSGPSKGVLSGNPPNLTYTPNAGTSGPDSFTYLASDGTADSDPATVSINVTAPVNSAPVALAKSASTTMDKPVMVALSATDPNGDSLTYAIVSAPINGVLSGTAPNLTYTPNKGFVGSDSFSYKANDGSLDSNVAMVSIKVLSSNVAPVAAAKSVSTNEDRAVSVGLSASDKERNPLTYSVVSGPANGVLSGTPPRLVFTPAADFHGKDSFTFKANDGTSDSNIATVSINVVPVNDPPVASAASVESINDVPVAITLSASDKDSATLAYKVVKQPAKGRLTGTAPNLTYTPAPGFSGSDQFYFVAHDGKVRSNTALVQITITDPNDAPVFTVNPIQLPAGSSGIAYIGQSIASSVTDPDKVETLVFSKVTGPDWLEISPNGALSGTPPVEAEGLNEFAVRVTDKEGVYADSVLLIQIHPPELPLPWEMAKIGDTTMVDGAGYQAETFTLQGSGSLASAADEGCFVWQTLSGDGEIIARVSALEGDDPLADAGVMIRDSLAANAPHIFLGLNGKGSIRRASRDKAGMAAAMRTFKPGTRPGIWLRLTRKGNVVAAYASVKGVKWSLIDSRRTAFAANCYIGLSVSGGVGTQSASAFRDVKVVP